MTTPVSGVNGVNGVITTTPPAGAGASTSMAQSLLDPQAFLQLLVAQLKYQDPASPTDTSAFMNQTAQLSQVQTMNSMSTTLTSLATAQQTQAATGMIGKEVTYLDAGGIQKKGVVDAASLQGGTATVTVGGTSVSLDKVLEVRNAATS
jgi:flagellar basal-body rod modification protein FlgD